MLEIVTYMQHLLVGKFAQLKPVIFLLLQLMCDEYSEREKRRCLMDEKLRTLQRQQGLLPGILLLCNKRNLLVVLTITSQSICCHINLIQMIVTM